MNKVYITGLGCVTPLGNNIETLWNGLIEGRCGIAPIAAPHAETLPVHVAAEVKNFDPAEYHHTPQRYVHPLCPCRRTAGHGRQRTAGGSRC